MTTSVLLVLLFSGHALFAVSDVPADGAGQKSAAEAILPEHLQLRERSARGLTETGRPYNQLDLFEQHFVICRHFQVQQTLPGLQLEICMWLLFADPSQEGDLVAKADAVSMISNKVSAIDCTNGKCASPEEAQVHLD